MRVHVRHQQREVRGSTIFAVLMNWNTLFSLFVFIPAIWINFIKKVNDPVWPLSEVGRIWYGAVLVLWNCCELPRLYLGITGNKDHLIAPLLLFAVITFFIDLVIMVVFNFITPHGNALDKGLTSIQILFAVCELVFCSTIFSRMAHQNTVDYYAHVWGQERYNQSLIQRKKKGGGTDGASSYDYDDDDFNNNNDDDQFYHHNHRRGNHNNNNNDPDAPINANAPQQVFPHQKGKLGDDFENTNTRRSKKQNNNFSDYEMDSMGEEDKNNSSSDDDDDSSSNDDDDLVGTTTMRKRRKQQQQYSSKQWLASERNTDRDYTPAKGSREFLSMAPPLSGSIRHQDQPHPSSSAEAGPTSFRQKRKQERDLLAQGKNNVNNSEDVRTESPSRLLRSPSSRRGMTVNTLRDSKAFTDGALFATTRSVNEISNNHIVDDDDVGTNTEKKNKKSKRSSSSKKEKGIAPPLTTNDEDGKEKKKKKSSSKTNDDDEL